MNIKTELSVVQDYALADIILQGISMLAVVGLEIVLFVPSFTADLVGKSAFQNGVWQLGQYTGFAQIAAQLWAIVSYALSTYDAALLPMNHLANTVAAFISIMLVSPILSLLNSGDNIALSVFKGFYYVANGGALAYNLAQLMLLDLTQQAPKAVA